MRIKFNVQEYHIQTETEYTQDLLQNGRKFPLLTIGKDSYIEEAVVDMVLDEKLIYNFQIGRYSSIGPDVSFIIDLNPDYNKVCQGRISGIEYNRPERIKRKGQIIIMNDCWIGTGAVILSGVTIGNGAVVAAHAYVTSDVPPYAIVSGNPAKIIGYRFSEPQIRDLNIIRWWNWEPQKIKENADFLYGDICSFIQLNLNNTQKELSTIVPTDIKPILKENAGEEKILLYIPDFEQDYPTYPRVIEAFIKSYTDTNYELLLYVENDEFLDENMELLNAIFSKYEDANCYINLYIGNVADMRTIICQVNGYITNRSLSNVQNMDFADFFHVPVISGVDFPIFTETTIHKFKKVKKQEDVDLSPVIHSIRSLTDIQKNMQTTVQQLSINQMALDYSYDNMKYEIFSIPDKVQYPIIESGESAIDKIINEGKSLIRFGDGEFSLIGNVCRQKFQPVDPVLGKRLKEALQDNDPDILIGIADNYGDLSKYTSDAKYNIRYYLTEEVRKQHYALLDMNRTYYDAYVTRPYMMYMDKHIGGPEKRFEHIKKIWENRKLLIIEGSKTGLGVGNDLFKNAGDIIRIIAPAVNAFSQYDAILEQAMKQDKERLILIALGPTATVLAYDLAKAGYQAVDIGHIDIEYEWMLAGAESRTAVKNKYTNDVHGGDAVANIEDAAYEKQIIARYS